MNFNTANSTFRQLMGNGMSYRVPLFQRDYSWGGDEWDDLWQDLVALFGEDPEPAHYMGYLVLQSADTRAFDIIDGQQRIKDRSGDDGESVARFVDVAVDKLFFTIITVTDELNAFKVFETLNACGVRLSATDLLKNYLFSVASRDNAHESDINNLEDRWEGVVGLLGSESFPEFLRVFWNSRNRLVRKVDLFKTMRSAISDRASVFQLIRDMDRHARVYSALRSPEDDSWTAEERESLAQLQMFNVRQPLALLLAAFEQFEERDRAGFGRFLQAIAVVSFRYNVICGRQSNEQEVVYNQIARELAAGEIVSAKAAIARLRPVYPEDAEFRAAFADKALRTTSSRNNKVVRFILFRLEAQLSGQHFEFESAKHGIEHVLPENPRDDWHQFDDQQREASTYCLGNMTLLRTADNRDLGTSGYAEKRLVYQKSDFAITRKLAEDFDTWTVEKIRSHQTWMARQATGIWRVSF